MNDQTKRRPSAGRSHVITTVVFALVVLIPSCLGFANKFREFVLIFRGDVDGVFAITPIVNYLLASAGFFLLFFWRSAMGCFATSSGPSTRCSRPNEILISPMAKTWAGTDEFERGIAPTAHNDGGAPTGHGRTR